MHPLAIGGDQRTGRPTIPSAVRRGICVESKTKTIFSPSGRHLPSARPMMSLLTELCPFVGGDATNMPALTGFKKNPCFICG